MTKIVISPAKRGARILTRLKFNAIGLRESLRPEREDAASRFDEAARIGGTIDRALFPDLSHSAE